MQKESSLLFFAKKTPFQYYSLLLNYIEKRLTAICKTFDTLRNSLI